ncbi:MULTISPECIES: lysine exporter LysO family protein [unclassified Brenneria]|uniref:lysine exporter LysO family protein n=1 Tax=unclassified Brenneria TaxID=2634434 RepID=UPI00155477D1|nr:MULTISPECIES: lysine exporter LysO family protein [unclassified Brenneria]MBJ7220501.1 lysine exporter LysO family protein [Brenneria sp. L3-3C-1]MEE3641745.1 lysine exporter LysO family protein [Brenneria sp. L3_3C_1]MEE3649625.1 lysine exporter LysO family protein [Brenneria sp. HEZEL_4_2_4]NPC99583.1 lysine exporter LysO family protein [Brenneria sp. hezel4-2-4]
MYSGLLIILVPLMLGYLVPLRVKKILQAINQLLSWMVYVILFLMGISLAFLDNLSSNLLLIFQYTAVCTACIVTLNIAALWLLEKRYAWRGRHEQQTPPSRLHMILDSLKLCLVVFGGFLLGLTQWPGLTYASQGSEYALILLLFFVGIQLRNSGMTLRQIVLNRRGMMVALIVGVSALAGGLLAAWLLGLPLKTGLAIASGYGWYSLSGILLTDALGPVIGSAAFFNDLTRELLAIMLIPALAQRNRSCALGLCGATSMDFTLPVLQRSAGVEMVPAAIVHGFLLSLAAPILMAVFSS